LASLTAQPGRRFQTALPAFAFVLLVVVVYADPLFVRRNFGGRDLTAYNLPMEKTIHDAYSRGRLPVWSAEISGGRPLLPNPNAGALYPIRPLLSAFPFPFAMRLFPILHWIAAGIGMVILLGSLSASRAACWVGAVTYVFSGVGISEALYPHIQPGTALLPWIVWAIARSATKRPGGLVLLSILLGLACLAGDVFTVGTAIVSCGLWILLERPRSKWKGDFPLLSLALFLAGLLALPQIVATVLWAPETNRAILGMKLKDSFFFSISPFRLLELVIPFPFGSTFSLERSRIWGWPVFHSRPSGIFATLYAGALAAVGLVSWRGERAPGIRFARTLALLALLVSVLPSLLPEKWQEIPSPVPLRNPEKFAVALTLALSILAGLAFDRFRRAGRDRWILVVAALLALFAVAATLFPAPVGLFAVRVVGADASLSTRAAWIIAPALAEAGLLWCATAVALDLARRSGRLRIAVSLALLSFVPIVANRRIAGTFREEEILAPTAFARFLQRRDPASAWRTLGESVYRETSRADSWVTAWDPTYTELPRRNWSEHTQVLWSRGTVLNYDYDVGDLSRLETLRQISQFAARHQRGEVFFGSLGLRWGIRFRDQRPLPGYRRFGGDMLQDWDENSTALPDIRLVKSWRETPGGIPALNEIGRLDRDEIVVETGVSRVGTAPGGEVRVLEKHPERMVLETRALQATWLFVLRGHWEYRTVLLDGREVEVQPAQLAFSAVAIPKGIHRLHWQERVPGGRLSRWGPVLFVLLGALILFRERGVGGPGAGRSGAGSGGPS
jgi:hypothetical protein